MAWYLTQQQLNYGKQHEVILTGIVGQPMASSKIAVSGGNPSPIGIRMTDGSTIGLNFNQSWSGLYGQFTGEVGRWGQCNMYVRFFTLKHFVVTRLRWYWTRDHVGWNNQHHAVYSFKNGVDTVVWYNTVGAGNIYDYTFPDSYILSWNLLSPNDGPGINMVARNDGGNFRGILEARGFQTPYPNIAQFKNENGQLSTFCQTAAYKDNDGIIHTAGRLL